LKAGKVLRKELLRELSAAEDDDEVGEFLSDSNAGEPASGYNAKPLRSAVEKDRQLLEDMCHQATAIDAAHDPKLARLSEELARMAEQAAKDGIDEQDRRRKRKVLVFSFYTDTIDWIEEYLNEKLETDPRLAAYKGRLASVAGNESRHGISRDAAVKGF